MLSRFLRFQGQEPERPLRDRFDTNSDIPNASARIVQKSVNDILSSPLTHILYECAEWRDGKQLHIKLSDKKTIGEFYIQSTAEYVDENHGILVNRNALPRSIVINHELRHAWQAVAMDTHRYTDSDPYTHFMFKQIIEADAHAYSNMVYGVEFDDMKIPLSHEQTKLSIDRYRRDFLNFLFGEIFLTKDFLNIDLENYKYAHLRSAAAAALPYSWVFRGKNKPEQPHANPERVAEAIEQLSIVGLTAQPVRFFSSDDAREITEMLFDAHAKHPIVARKLAQIYEDLRGHYGPR